MYSLGFSHFIQGVVAYSVTTVPCKYDYLPTSWDLPFFIDPTSFHVCYHSHSAFTVIFYAPSACEDQTISLQSNAEVQTAFAVVSNVYTDVLVIPAQSDFCQVDTTTMTDASVTCNVNLRDVEGSEALASACRSAGGKCTCLPKPPWRCTSLSLVHFTFPHSFRLVMTVVESDLFTDCTQTNTAAGSNISIVLDLKNMAVCVAQVCTDNDVPGLIANTGGGLSGPCALEPRNIRLDGESGAISRSFLFAGITTLVTTVTWMMQ